MATLSVSPHRVFLARLPRSAIRDDLSTLIRILFYTRVGCRGLFSYTESPTELTLVLDRDLLASLEATPPAGLTVHPAEWRALRVSPGPEGFDPHSVGAITSVLARAGISILYQSTFSTDIILIPGPVFVAGAACLYRNGFCITYENKGPMFELPEFRDLAATPPPSKAPKQACSPASTASDGGTSSCTRLSAVIPGSRKCSTGSADCLGAGDCGKSVSSVSPEEGSPTDVRGSSDDHPHGFVRTDSGDANPAPVHAATPSSAVAWPFQAKSRHGSHTVRFLPYELNLLRLQRRPGRPWGSHHVLALLQALLLSSCTPGPQPVRVISFTETDDEVSLLLPEESVACLDTRHGDVELMLDSWVPLQVGSHIDFEETGVVASLSATLVGAGLSTFYWSTFSTGLTFVLSEDEDEAVTTLSQKYPVVHGLPEECDSRAGDCSGLKRRGSVPRGSCRCVTSKCSPGASSVEAEKASGAPESALQADDRDANPSLNPAATDSCKKNCRPCDAMTHHEEAGLAGPAVGGEVSTKEDLPGSPPIRSPSKSAFRSIRRVEC